MFVPIIKMEKQLLYIEEKSYHLSGNLVDISKFDSFDLELDKKK